MKTCIIFSMLAFGSCVYAQDHTSSILAISGASEAEELDETVLERFESLSRHPININSAPRSKLLSCGLFTSYQAGVICDYRKREGDILSFAELSSLGGFSPELADALRPFISLASAALPGRSSTERTYSADFIAKGSFRKEREKDDSWQAGAKLRVENQDRWTLSAAYRDELSASAVRYWRSGKLILGDYNARFGQGLALWSGFSLSGLSSVASFNRRGTGLSPTWTFSPTSALRGAAMEQEWKRLNLSAMAAIGEDGIAPSANLSWYGRDSQLGVTVAGSGDAEWKAAADFRMSKWGWDLFGEVACDLDASCLAFACGAIWNIDYDVKLAFQGRTYPSGFSSEHTGAIHSWSKTEDETGVSAGLQYGKLTLTLDGAYKSGKDAHQFKLLATHSFSIGKNLSLNARVTERYRPLETLLFRTDARIDLKWAKDAWMAQARANMLACRDMGMLAYLEAGYTPDRLRLYARATWFSISNWDDRIYVWERDAPGSFNVPAYYGHGWSASLAGSWNKKLYLRIFLLASDRTVKTDLRLQYSYHFFHLNAPGSLDKHGGSRKRVLAKPGRKRG